MIVFKSNTRLNLGFPANLIWYYYPSTLPIFGFKASSSDQVLLIPEYPELASKRVSLLATSSQFDKSNCSTNQSGSSTGISNFTFKVIFIMAQRSERAHVASPLPPLLKTEPLTASQWDTLMAIGETIIPAIEPSPKASRGKLSIDSSEYASIAGSLKSMASSECDLAVITTFLDESPSTHPDSRELLHRLLSEHIPSDARRGMAILLSALK